MAVVWKFILGFSLEIERRGIKMAASTEVIERSLGVSESRDEVGSRSVFDVDLVPMGMMVRHPSGKGESRSHPHVPFARIAQTDESVLEEAGYRQREVMGVGGPDAVASVPSPKTTTTHGPAAGSWVNDDSFTDDT
jgi:hypothetical protein